MVELITGVTDKKLFRARKTVIAYNKLYPKPS